MANIHLVCDYVIARTGAAGEVLTHIKLQKLMYYIQAWHWAFFNKPLFAGKFQAWVHGPVNRDLYDRFAESKSLYSPICLDDAREKSDFSQLTGEDKAHIENILESYITFTGSQLEQMTHQEQPWIDARTGYSEAQRCEVEINELTMQQFYSARL
jgi:uncharacterized phage-associated protein